MEKVRGSAEDNIHERPSLGAIRRKPQLPDNVAIVSRLKGEDWKDYGFRRADWARSMVPLAARKHAGMKTWELAEWLGGCGDSAITQATKHLEQKMQSDKKLRKFCEALETKTSKVKM